MRQETRSQLALPDPGRTSFLLRRRARKWRCLSAGGGLLLAASFFMPAIQACNSPAVPVEYAYSMLLTESWFLWPVYFSWFVAAYAFWLLVAVGALLRLTGTRSGQRAVSAAVLAILVTASGAAIVTSAVHAYETDWANLSSRDLYEGADVISVLLLIPVLMLAYLMRTRRLRRRRWLAHSFVASLWCVAWFGFYLIGSVVLYGLVCSFIGSLLILLAVVGETGVLTGRSYLRALAGLLVGRIGRLEEDRGRCETCEYPLIGLTVNRCPECGRAFERRDLDAARPSEVEPSLLGACPQPDCLEAALPEHNRRRMRDLP